MCYSIKVQQQLDSLWRKLGAMLVEESYQRYAQLTKADPKKYKSLENNSRIYPYYFASVMYRNYEGETKVEPMRYQAWPPSYKEDPHHLTLYNARLDNLRSNVWQDLFMVHHGVLVASNFYEWVLVRDLLAQTENGISKEEIEEELIRKLEVRKEKALESGKKFKVTPTEKLPFLERKITVAFSRSDEEKNLFLPVIFAEKQNHDGTLFKSFAVITTDPPPIVLSAGHDRCPISFNSEEAMNKYLEPWKSNSKEIEDLLHNQKPPALQFALDKDG